MAYTVKKLAAMSGVSVRTLHWYDEVGLLKPAYHGANGYRYYEETQLLTLQQILFYRELGFELKQIKRVLGRSLDGDRTLDVKRGRLQSDHDCERGEDSCGANQNFPEHGFAFLCSASPAQPSAYDDVKRGAPGSTANPSIFLQRAPIAHKQL